jgi:hypothetical protein
MVIGSSATTSGSGGAEEGREGGEGDREVMILFLVVSLLFASGLFVVVCVVCVVLFDKVDTLKWPGWARLLCSVSCLGRAFKTLRLWLLIMLESLLGNSGSGQTDCDANK